MNIYPEEYMRVPHGDLERFVSAVARKVAVPADQADQLARWLVANDLMGNFSHGSSRIAGYAPLMRDGKVNPAPKLKVIRETPTTVHVDGDGGLGYFAAYDATERAAAKALAHGMAMMMTSNHHHIGAAGIYVRQTLVHDLLTFMTSSTQLVMKPAAPIYAAAGGSPIAFSFPAGEEDPFVLDFGTMHDLYPSDPHRDELARLAPGLVLRSIGLGEVCQILSGLLAGNTVEAADRERKYAGAYQGSFLFTFKIANFIEPAEFKRQMDRYVRAVRALKPFEGIEGAYLPGGVEAERRRECLAQGVRVSPRHRDELEAIGEEFDVAAPWRS